MTRPGDSDIPFIGHLSPLAGSTRVRGPPCVGTLTAYCA